MSHGGTAPKTNPKRTANWRVDSSTYSLNGVVRPAMMIYKSFPVLGMMACLAFAFAGVNSSLVFPSSSPSTTLAGLAMYATPVTSFTGPQPGDADNARTGPVVVFTGDMCKPTTLHVPGSVLIVSVDAVSNAGCTFETRYLTMYATGAVATLCPVVDVVPSVDLYSNDGSQGARTRQLPMLFLQIGPSSDLYSTLINDAAGLNVTVYPDVNVWQVALASWYYQLFIRALPSVVMIASGVTATVYFVLHMRIIDEEYEGAVALERRSLSRWIVFARRYVGLPHAILTIEMITTTLTGIVLAIDGHFSTPNLPYPVVQYFITVLSGWSFLSSLLSASVWVRHLSRVVESKTLLSRVLIGDHPVVFAMLAIIPVAIDTVVSVMFSVNYDAPAVTTIASGILFLLQLTVGLHVLNGVVRYFWTIRETTRALGTARGMDAVLMRLGRCAFGMSLSMILVCTGTALMAVSPTFLYSPPGWIVCFSLAYNGRALDSAFRVAMFKPRPTRSRAVTDLHKGRCVQITNH